MNQTNQNPIGLEERKAKWVIVGALLLFTNNMLINYGVAYSLIAMLTKLDGMAYYTYGSVMNTLGTMLMCPVAGRLSDLYGRKWITIGGIAGMMLILGAASFAAGPIPLLILYLLNGLCMGMAIGAPQAILGDVTCADNRARFFSYLTVFGALGTLGGPFLSSLLIDKFGAGPSYFVSWPLGIISIILLARFYPNSRSVSGNKNDFLGLLLMVVAIGCLATYVNFGSSLIGWMSTAGLALLAIGVLSAALFTVRTIKVENPIVDLSLFKDNNYRVSWFTRFLFSGYLTPSSTYIVLLGTGVLALSSTKTSTFSMAQTILMMVFSPIVGKMLAKSKKTYKSGWILIGLMTAVALLIWRSVTDAASANLLYVGFLAGGIAYSYFQTLYAPYFMETVDASRWGAANGTSSFASTAAGVIYGAIYGAIYNGAADAATGVRMVFTVAIVSSVISLLMGIFLVKVPTERENN